MATKYVRADGSATWANAVGPESSASDCCNLATAETSPSPGDTVWISGLGGEFREMFQTKVDGASGNYITYRGTANTPIISGADVASGFSDQTGNVWEATVTASDVRQVFFDGEKGVDVGSVGALSQEFDWTWSSNTLSVYSPSDPDSRYGTVEASVRLYAMAHNVGDHYVTIQDLHLRYANDAGVQAYLAPYCKVIGCEIDYNYYLGIFAEGADDFLTQGCHIHHSGESHGIYYSNGCDGAIIEHCHIHNTDLKGIQVNANPRNTGMIFRHNKIHDIGQDGIGDLAGNGTLIQNNVIYGCGDYGVDLVYDFDDDPSHTRVAINSLVYGNTIYDCDIGIVIGAYATGHTIKNNAISTCTTKLISKNTNGSATIDYNLYYDTSYTGKWSWNGSNYSTFAAWKSASSQDGNSPDPADPKFTNPGGGDFTLQSDSPCIGAAENLGASYDDGLLPTSVFPTDVNDDGVVTGDRDDY